MGVATEFFSSWYNLKPQCPAASTPASLLLPASNHLIENEYDSGFCCQMQFDIAAISATLSFGVGEDKTSPAKAKRTV